MICIVNVQRSVRKRGVLVSLCGLPPPPTLVGGPSGNSNLFAPGLRPNTRVYGPSNLSLVHCFRLLVLLMVGLLGEKIMDSFLGLF